MKKYISSSIQRTFSPIFLKAAFITTEFMKTIKADFYTLKIDFLYFEKVSNCQFREIDFADFFAKKFKIDYVIKTKLRVRIL